MSNYTMTATFSERGKTYEKYTSFKLGNNWIRCLNGHADKVPVNQPCDIEYREWQNPKGGTTYFLNKVNGTDVSKAPPAAAPSGGGPLGSGGDAGPLGKAPASSGRQSDWDVMGPENRARFAVKDIMSRRYGNEKLDIGSAVSLGAEMQIIYQAWLSAVEGKGMPHATGNSQGSVSGDLDDGIPDFGDDPGPSGPEDYDRA